VRRQARRTATDPVCSLALASTPSVRCLSRYVNIADGAARRCDHPGPLLQLEQSGQLQRRESGNKVVIVDGGKKSTQSGSTGGTKIQNISQKVREIPP
jgi:hypothetical protein